MWNWHPNYTMTDCKDYLDREPARWYRAVDNAKEIGNSSKAGAEQLAKHYLYCKEDPTAGMIIGQKYIFGKDANAKFGRKNLRSLMETNLVKEAKARFDKKFSELYPKTGTARKLLVKLDNFDLENVCKIAKHCSKRQMINFWLKLVK